MLIYDIECFKNLFSITFYDTEYKTTNIYLLYNNIEKKLTKKQVKELVKNETLVGFRNSTYDDIMLDFLLSTNVTNEHLKDLNDTIITSSKTNPWQIRKRFIPSDYSHSYKSIDLYERSPLTKSSLKSYEHYAKLNDIDETPIDFDSVIESDEQVQSVLYYNLQDVMATDLLYNEVQPLLDSLDDLSKTYKTSDLRSQSAGKIVDLFFEPTVKPDPIPGKRKQKNKDDRHPGKIIVDLKQSIDFKIKNDNVREHLDKLLNYPVTSFDYSDLERENNTDIIDNDIIETTDCLFEENIMNVTLKFGIGGIHSSTDPLELTSNDEYTILDCDVNGMYPNVLQKQMIHPFYFSDETKNRFFSVYREIMNKRDKLKSEGSHLQESYKLILNTVTGKFKESFSILFDPSCHIKICTYGQYFLWSVLEQVEHLSQLICQVNTDGFTLWIKRENVDKVKEILNTHDKIAWKTKEFNSWHSKDCNNYVSVTNDGEIKMKGSQFNPTTLSIPRIIKQSLVDFLISGTPVEESIKNPNNKMYDYLYFTKPKGQITINDIPFNGKVIRFYKSINGNKIKSNGKTVSNGINVKLQNHIDELNKSDIDYNFYINEVNRAITKIRGNQHEESLKIFNKYGIKMKGKTPLWDKDTKEFKYKGNSNLGSKLFSYETVSVNTGNDLLVIDIDSLLPEHKTILDMCKDSKTLYSTSDIPEKESFRFIFKNNKDDINGHLVWGDKIEKKLKVSFEIFTRYKQDVCVSGIKVKDVDENILENYILVGENILDLPENIYQWIIENPPSQITGDKFDKNYIPEFIHTDKMKMFFDIIKENLYDKKIRYDKKNNSIIFRKEPNWFPLNGGTWTSSLVLFMNGRSHEFDIIIKSYKPGFDNEYIKMLKEEIQPFINQINSIIPPEIIPLEIDDEIDDEIIESPISECTYSSIESDMDEDGILDEYDLLPQNDLETTPTFSDEIYEDLPDLLKNLCNLFKGRERDVLLTSLFGSLSVIFPTVKTNYWYSNECLNLFIFIAAKAASGKGIMKHGIKTLTKIDKDYYEIYIKEYSAWKQLDDKLKKITEMPICKKIVFTADTSKAKLVQDLNINKYNAGIIYDTEADVLSSNQKTEWGNISEQLRKGFHNEPISSSRIGSGDIVVEHPILSVLVSGTLEQVSTLLGPKGASNGLMSRFIYYTWSEQSVWKNPFEKSNSFDNEFFIASNSIQNMRSEFLRDKFYLELTPNQQTIFNKLFTEHLKGSILWSDDSYSAIIKRHGLIAIKIFGILTMIRRYENSLFSSINDKTISIDGENYKIINGDDIDFNNIMKIIKVYIYHSNLVFGNMEGNTDIIWNSKSDKHKNLFENLPDVFKRTDAQKIGKAVYSMSESTINRLLAKLLKDKKLVKRGKLIYEKK